MNHDKLFDQLCEEEKLPTSVKILKVELENFVDFIEEVMRENEELFTPENFEDLVFIGHFFKMIDPVKLMEIFIKKVLPYSAKIKERDEDYFEHNVLMLFNTLPQEKIMFIYDLFVNNKINKDDKNIIWDYWNVFVDLAEKNKKKK